MGLFNFFKKKDTGLLKVDTNQKKQEKPKIKKTLKPSDKFLIEFNADITSMNKYNMEIIEAEYVGEKGRFWGALDNIYGGISNKDLVSIYLKHKKNYVEKANFKVNIYDIIWSFIQSEKLRLPQKYIQEDIFVKHIEEDYKESEKWFKWRLKSLEIDDERHELYQQSKELNQRIKEEDDKVLIKELKETKKALNEELKRVREKMQKINLKNPAKNK